jgi:hypothetical protein
MANRSRAGPRKRVGRSASVAETTSTSSPLGREVDQPRFAWLWLAFLLGAAIRIYLIVGTEGTYDVPVWEKHAQNVHDLGLASYYQKKRDFNHPPATGFMISWLWSLARETGIPFRIVLRAPLAIFDLATAVLLLRLLRENRRRYAIAAIYWLCPLSMIFSSYHGNTDTVVAFFALLALVCASQGRDALSGAAIGAGFALKVPTVLAAPVLFFSITGWQSRLRFVAACVGVASLLYLPGLVTDPVIVLRNVLFYGGLAIETPGGVKLWGIQSFYPMLLELPMAWHGPIAWILLHYYVFNTPVCLLLVTIFAWFRRRETSPQARGASIGMAFSIFYGFTNYWAFQYFAWCVPFLLCIDLRFALPALAMMTAYIYGLYAWLCDNPYLRGQWDFMGHPYWPFWLLAIRDSCIGFFFLCGCCFLAIGLAREVRWRKELRLGPPNQVGKKHR